VSVGEGQTPMWPSTGYASDSQPRDRPSPARSSSQLTARRCAGCSGCFEGLDLLHIRHGPEPALALVLRVQPIHQQVLALLGPSYEAFYKSTN
jgi:hypothetical protein